MSGLIPMSVVAEFLGKRPGEMRSVVELDGLPVILVPAETRPLPKVSLIGLHGWLRSRSQNAALSVDELEMEIERAAAAVRARAAARKGRKEARAA